MGRARLHEEAGKSPVEKGRLMLTPHSRGERLEDVHTEIYLLELWRILGDGIRCRAEEITVIAHEE